jgi:hypothetical protein
LVAVAVAGLVLAGGMLGLLRLTGAPVELVSGPVSDRPPSGQGTTAAATTEPAATGSGAAFITEAPMTDSAATSTEAPTTAAAVAAPAATTAALQHESDLTVTSVSSDAVARDPVSLLQKVADRRAAALVAADPVLLVGAEPEGSSAHEGDASTIARLREQRQRYAELSFAVRSAEVVSAAATTVVLRAVVDRSAYAVAGEDGSSQRVDAGAGVPLRYTLTLHDGGWRLTEVGAP